ncbi:MAG: hypothetical protein WCV93_02905 [Candidatus Shapirobacteria bacterium]|jgi:hypothetical protein
MSGFEFIKSKELRQTLENSIEYIYTLYERAKNGEEKQLYKEETYRVIILYVISVIEAVLFYFYKERGEKIESFEYKYINQLPQSYTHTLKKDMPIVVAVQEKIEKSQVGLYELIKFFRGKKLIKESTASDILELNDIRNTFHLNKARTKRCDIKQVESALKLLVHTIENAPKALKIN